MSVTARFWVANRISSRSIDLAFRVASAGILSSTSRRRYAFGGIGLDEIETTLRRVRRLSDWSISWAQTARHELSLARRARDLADRHEAARHQASAALCFHFGQLFEIGDLTRRRHLYHRAADLFRPIAAALRPAATYIEIPWRGIALPGYLRLPSSDAVKHPLVVFLNGASTVKEETTSWSEAFLRRGLATLALDTPGSGEAWDRALGHPGQNDIAGAILAYVDHYPRLDMRRVALLGVSLRAAMAVQLTAAEERLAAAVAVTGPFHPAAYFHQLNELVRHEIMFTSGMADAALARMVEEMSLIEVAPKLRAPLLVVGAGKDLVVPPDESRALYDAAAGPKQLLFIDDANHVAFSHMARWTDDAARWLRETMGEGSGRVRYAT